MSLFCHDKVMVEYDGEALLPCARLKRRFLKTSKCSLITKCGVAIHALHVHQTECWSEYRPVLDEQTVTRDALKRCSPYFSISKMKPSFLLSWGQTEGGQREITLLWMRHLHTSPIFALRNPLFCFCSVPLPSLKSPPPHSKPERMGSTGLSWGRAKPCIFHCNCQVLSPELRLSE